MPFATHTRKIVVLLAILALAGTAGLYGAFVIIKNNSAKASRLEAQAAEAEASKARDAALANLLEEIRPERTALEFRYVSSDGTVGFIESLESLATSNHLSRTVGSVKLEPGDEKDKAPEGYEWLRLNLTTDGGWEDTYRFLELLESLPYKMSIDAASLNVSKQEKGLAWEGRYFLSVLKQK